jgi:hypothetical protein
VAGNRIEIREKISDLTGRMNSRIGSPCRRDPDRMAMHPLERSLNGSLYRSALFLHLPA